MKRDREKRGGGERWPASRVAPIVRDAFRRRQRRVDGGGSDKIRREASRCE